MIAKQFLIGKYQSKFCACGAQRLWSIFVFLNGSGYMPLCTAFVDHNVRHIHVNHPSEGNNTSLRFKVDGTYSCYTKIYL